MYHDALSRLGGLPGPLLLMIPSDLATRSMPRTGQPHRSEHGLGGSWQRHPAGLPPLGRYRLASVRRFHAPPRQRPHLCVGRPGLPRLQWDNPMAAFHDHGLRSTDTWQMVREKTLRRDYLRCARACLLKIRDFLRQRWDDLWLRQPGTWSPTSHLSHTCRLCGACDTLSSSMPAGTNRCARCSQVAACPCPEPPPGLRQRTEEEALRRRIQDAQTSSDCHAGRAGAALLWIHVHLRDPTSVFRS